MSRKKKELPVGIVTEYTDLPWRVHTYNLIMEVFNNDKMGIFKIPFNIFGKMLYELGEVAIRINDDELNGIMAKMTIYTMGDPNDPEYDYAMYQEVMRKYQIAKQKNKKQ